MSHRRPGAGRADGLRAIVAVTAASACFGAVALAAVPRGHDTAGLASPKSAGEEASPRARFLEYPETISVQPQPRFRFHVPPRSPSSQRASPRGQSGRRVSPRRFECRLDGGGWLTCSSPYRLSDPDLGEHVFAVRALTRAGRAGPPVSHRWQQARPSSGSEPPEDPRRFSIELAGDLEDLQPEDQAQALPVLVTNPNSVPIEVTSLTVAIGEEAPGCSSENFSLGPSGASDQTPLPVPAGASVRLPTAMISAPTIGMRNLAVNQDSCQGIDVPLVFNGEANG